MSNNLIFSTTTIAGHTYRVKRLNALQQIHVARRLSPAMAVLGIKAAILAKRPGAAEEGISIEEFLPLLQPISEVFSKMSEEDVNYIIFTCLSIVERDVEGRGQVVLAGGAPMFADMNMDVIIKLVLIVVRENLGGFFPGLDGEAPSSSS